MEFFLRTKDILFILFIGCLTASNAANEIDEYKLFNEVLEKEEFYDLYDETYNVYKLKNVENRTIGIPVQNFEKPFTELKIPFEIYANIAIDNQESSCLFSIYSDFGEITLSLYPAVENSKVVELVISNQVITSLKFNIKEEGSIWVKLFLKVEENNVSLYINCDHVASIPTKKPLQTITIPEDAVFYLGKSYADDQRLFNGLIEDLKIFPLPDVIGRKQLCEGSQLFRIDDYSTNSTIDKQISEISEKPKQLLEENKEKAPIGLPEKGEKGEEGEKGEKGDKGDTVVGRTGLQGPPGFNGSCQCSEKLVSQLLKNMPEMRGPRGDKGPVGEIGPRGPPGLQGPPGTPGINGTNGINGKDGERGSPGIDGKNGVPGIHGINGTKGEKGDRGERGENGDRGETGRDGKPGKDGERGDRGERGEMGPIGKDGLKGDKGDTGPPGAPAKLSSILTDDVTPFEKKEIIEKMKDIIKGDKGDNGLQGKTGDTGPIGPIGPRGPRGEIGPIGHKGDRGIKGEPGEPGKQGPPGAVVTLPGINPIKGSKGNTGQRGSTGPRGPRGHTGSRGPNGPKGEPGIKIKGDKGDRGDTGKPGENGKPGLPGTCEKCQPTIATGKIGPPGTPGPPGPPGPPGSVGPPGPPGPPGPAGSPGPTGPKGPPGSPGSHGLSIVGPKGEPGEIISRNSVLTDKNEGNEDDDESYTTQTIICKTTIALFKKTSNTALGTLAYVLQEKILLLRVEEGWQHVEMGALHRKREATTQKPQVERRIAEEPINLQSTEKYDFLPQNQITRTPTTQRPQPRRTVAPPQHTEKYIRIVALNEPYPGNMSFIGSSRTGRSSVEQMCHKQSRQDFKSSTFVPLLSSSVVDLRSIIKEEEDRRVPVINLFGSQLFDSWLDMTNGSGAVMSSSIFSFRRKSVLVDNTWPIKAVWHGSSSYGYSNKTALCNDWHSSNYHDYGAASPLTHHSLLKAEMYPCENKLIVLCVEITSRRHKDKKFRRRRHSNARSQKRLKYNSTETFNNRIPES